MAREAEEREAMGWVEYEQRKVERAIKEAEMAAEAGARRAMSKEEEWQRAVKAAEMAFAQTLTLTLTLALARI